MQLLVVLELALVLINLISIDVKFGGYVDNIVSNLVLKLLPNFGVIVKFRSHFEVNLSLF